jgi:branched-chain amino acid transport system substrate-binding protein
MLAVCVLVASLLIPFSGSSAIAKENMVKVGVTVPLTGPSALWGRDCKTSIEMAFDAIDYKIGDYKFEMVWIDSQYDPAKATNAFAEAVERKGITVAFWDVHSSISVALMDVVADYKIPLFFPLGAADTINKKWLSDPEKYSYFGGKAWAEPGKMSMGYIECLNDALKKGVWKPKTKRVAIYGEDTDWGRSLAGRLKSAFEETGWEIFSEDYVPTTQVDFYPILTKYKRGKVAVIAGTITSAASMTGMIKQAREIGLDATIIADGLGWSGDWYKMTGTDSDNVMDMIPQLNTPAAKKWASTVKEKYGFVPSASAGGQAFDYANYFIKVARRVLEKYGNMDRDSFYRILVDEVNTGKLTYTQAEGAIIMKEYKYTAETMPDPLVGQDYYYFPVLQYKDGKGHMVYPEAWKEKDIVLK